MLDLDAFKWVFAGGSLTAFNASMCVIDLKRETVNGISKCP